MNRLKQNTYLRRLYQLVANSLVVPPLVVLVAILIITIWPWQNARQNLNKDIDKSISTQTQEVQDRLNATFGTINNVLEGGVGLLKTSPQLTRSQWNTFFESTDSTTDRTGIQAISYIDVFNSSELNQITSAMLDQGATDFSVKPAEPVREKYSAVLQLYPETELTRGVIGFDMLTIPVRKKGMEQAIKTGKPVLSERLKLLQSVKTDDEYGFILFTPFFKPGTDASTSQSREQNIEGFVVGGFRSKRFFNKIVGDVGRSNRYSIEIYDGSVDGDNKLYETENFAAINSGKNIRKVTKPMIISDRTWQFVFTFNTNQVASASERSAPVYILVVGIITAFLVFLALLSIFKSRARELQQQKDMEVNLAKDELLSLASHQMRTPATGVKQYLGMVLQGFAGEIDDSQKALLDKAYTSNERQLHVINQILHLAKLESGRIVLAKHETNLNELVNDIVDEQQDDIKNRGHTLKLQVPKKVIKLSIDSHMIRMALENILSNAIKYTIDPGTISVKVSQAPESVKVIIKDSGIGIEPSLFPEIFKQFTRLYDEQAERVSGTGVGLYLADQLVRLHKGSLVVHSNVGEGSEFIMTLPKNAIKKQ